MKYIFLLFLILLTCCGWINEKTHLKIQSFSGNNITEIIVGAELTELYFDILKDKRIAVVCNHTSYIKNKHLIDTLLSSGFIVLRVFVPEHGFRGEAEAGESVNDQIDNKTKLPIISLYGKTKKPLPEHLQGIDIVVFDIQDVGARFYTYVSTLHYVMESCAEQKIPLLILDRPNPNGFYVDGPILEPEYRSFVGMHSIPIVYGMTIGELALMINEEGWLKNGIKCQLTIIPLKGYTHSSLYKPPIAPSPNLQSYEAIILYPSLCLFEGTDVSVGRGTDFPFLVIGHPLWPDSSFSFVPRSRPGFALRPHHLNMTCYGRYLSDYADSIIRNPYIRIEFVIEAYQLLKDKTNFFSQSSFDRLAGTSALRYHILSGLSAEQIRQSWVAQIQAFKQIRKKYLLYPDFE